MLPRWLEGLPEPRQSQVRVWGQRGLIVGAVSLFVFLGTFSIALPTLLAARDTLQLEVGSVASRDILAPHSLTFNSEILTQEAKVTATSNVPQVYDPDPDVTRDQIKWARGVTAYINAVRGDPYATVSQKVKDLLLIENLDVGGEIWGTVINTPETRWDLMSNEVVALVERTMQRDIRPANLDSIRNTLINSVATRFSNEEALIIVTIARDMILPNSFFNQIATEARQAEVAAAVPPQQRSFEQGQLIVRSGTLITERDMEALRQFGFLQPENIRLQKVFGAFLAMLIATVILGLYLDRFHPRWLQSPKLSLLFASLFLIFLASVNLFGDEGTKQPYLYPAAALGLLLTTLFSPQLAIVASAVLAMLVSLTFTNEQALEIATYTIVGNIAGILGMRRIERLNSFFVAGLVIGAANMVVMLAFAMVAEETPSLGQLIGRGFITAADGLFAAGIALVGLYVITSVTNLTTSLKLIELMDSKQPLLQRLLREAPGTYQHSLQVANLSELAAEAIGADAQLVRVAAMYHDIGKTLNPFFFGENTPPGINPHKDLADPHRSAKVIIGHVIEGEKIARRANLPERIREFILEHHGTTQVLYFYNQAIDQAGGKLEAVEMDEFTYPGPAPRSRETAIMMLADGCESATRSIQPTSKEDVEKMVNTIFELRLSEGQLDNSGLTLNDIKMIRQTFIETLQAMYHPRIAYQMRHQVPLQQGSEKRLASGFVQHLEKERRTKKVDTITQKQIKAAIDSAVTPSRASTEALPTLSDRTTVNYSSVELEQAADEALLDSITPDEPI